MISDKAGTGIEVVLFTILVIEIIILEIGFFLYSYSEVVSLAFVADGVDVG